MVAQYNNQDSRYHLLIRVPLLLPSASLVASDFLKLHLAITMHLKFYNIPILKKKSVIIGKMRERLHLVCVINPTKER